LTALTARPEVHSVGLDEAVRLETDAAGDGTLTAFLPLHDVTGNLAVLVDASGRPLELSALDVLDGVALNGVILVSAALAKLAAEVRAFIGGS
jgi:hypothetical protein